MFWFEEQNKRTENGFRRDLTLTALYFLYENLGDQRVFFNLEALSDSFEYLCYGCTIIIKMLTLAVRG